MLRSITFIILKGGGKMKVIKQGVSPVSVTTKGQVVKSVPGSLS